MVRYPPSLNWLTAWGVISWRGRPYAASPPRTTVGVPATNGDATVVVPIALRIASGLSMKPAFLIASSVNLASVQNTTASAGSQSPEHFCSYVRRYPLSASVGGYVATSAWYIPLAASSPAPLTTFSRDWAMVSLAITP